MPGAILQPTGPPLIRYYPGAAIGEDLVEVELPLAAFDEGLAGAYDDESRANQRAGGTIRVVGVENRRRFRLGYRLLREAYSDALVRSLITGLSRRVVLFTPRTLSAADDPGAASEVEEVPCRVLSDVPVTRHLTLDYSIDIELEALDIEESE